MRIPVLPLVMLAAACGSVEEEVPIPAMPAGSVVCTMEARPGISVEPVDKITGQIVSGPTVLIVKSGTYADTVRASTGAQPAPTNISGAYERPGTYTIIVRHAGYHDFVKSGIVVTKDECHVIPVRIKAQLEPAG
jgi:hypothetical protein